MRAQSAKDSTNETASPRAKTWHPHPLQWISWRTAFLILLSTNALWIGGDLHGRVKTKLDRKGLGTIRNDADYLSTTRSVGMRWFQGTPPLEVSDRAETFVEKVLKYRDPKAIMAENPLQYSSHQAVLAKGISISCRESGNKVELQAIEQYVSAFLDARTSINGKLVLEKMDEGMNGESVLFLLKTTRNQKYRNAADTIAQYYLEQAIRAGGTIPYRGVSNNGLRFVDALAMMCPFLAQYGALFDRPEAIDLSVTQLTAFIEHGVDKQTGLPFHAYDPSTGNTPVELLGWGRGTGWYAIGLIDTLGELPHGSENRATFEKTATRLVDVILRFQRADGGWGSLITYSESKYDSSATAFLVYFLQRATEEQLVAESVVREPVQRAIESLKDHTRADGTVDFSEGDYMGLARMSQRYAPSAFSQGMLIAVMTKYLKQPVPEKSEQ